MSHNRSVLLTVIFLHTHTHTHMLHNRWRIRSVLARRYKDNWFSLESRNGWCKIYIYSEVDSSSASPWVCVAAVPPSVQVHEGYIIHSLLSNVREKYYRWLNASICLRGIAAQTWVRTQRSDNGCLPGSMSRPEKLLKDVATARAKAADSRFPVGSWKAASHATSSMSSGVAAGPSVRTKDSAVPKALPMKDSFALEIMVDRWYFSVLRCMNKKNKRRSTDTRACTHTHTHAPKKKKRSVTKKEEGGREGWVNDRIGWNAWVVFLSCSLGCKIWEVRCSDVHYFWSKLLMASYIHV